MTIKILVQRSSSLFSVVCHKQKAGSHYFLRSSHFHISRFKIYLIEKLNFTLKHKVLLYLCG